MADVQGTVVPAASALTTFIESQCQSESAINMSDHQALALQVMYDLQYQHDWSSLDIHSHSSTSASNAASLLRPLISGLPAHHVYIHPDDQVDILKQGLTDKDVPVDREWVLPTHLREKWTLRRFAEVFDAIDETPSGAQARSAATDDQNQYHGSRKRGKRLLMAVVNDDSTIVYYIVHDGIVKPRQN